MLNLVTKGYGVWTVLFLKKNSEHIKIIQVAGYKFSKPKLPLGLRVARCTSTQIS